MFDVNEERSNHLPKAYLLTQILTLTLTDAKHILAATDADGKVAPSKLLPLNYELFQYLCNERYFTQRGWNRERWNRTLFRVVPEDTTITSETRLQFLRPDTRGQLPEGQWFLDIIDQVAEIEPPTAVVIPKHNTCAEDSTAEQPMKERPITKPRRMVYKLFQVTVTLSEAKQLREIFHKHKTLVGCTDAVRAMFAPPVFTALSETGIMDSLTEGGRIRVYHPKARATRFCIVQHAADLPNKSCRLAILWVEDTPAGTSFIHTFEQTFTKACAIAKAEADAQRELSRLKQAEARPAAKAQRQLAHTAKMEAAAAEARMRKEASQRQIIWSFFPNLPDAVAMYSAYQTYRYDTIPDVQSRLGERFAKLLLTEGYLEQDGTGGMRLNRNLLERTWFEVKSGHANTRLLCFCRKRLKIEQHSKHSWQHNLEATIKCARNAGEQLAAHGVSHQLPVESVFQVSAQEMRSIVHLLNIAPFSMAEFEETLSPSIAAALYEHGYINPALYGSLNMRKFLQTQFQVVDEISTELRRRLSPVRDTREFSASSWSEHLHKQVIGSEET